VKFEYEKVREQSDYALSGLTYNAISPHRTLPWAIDFTPFRGWVTATYRKAGYLKHPVGK